MLKIRWVLLAWLFAGTVNAKTITITIDDEESLPAPVLEASSPNVTPATVVPEPKKEVPPPEPSASDANDPRRLVRYFCRMWKEESYTNMYWAMTSKYRSEVPFEKFKGLFDDDAERTGGLKDENIVVDDVDKGKEYEVTVDLRFNFVKARDRRVKAVLEKSAKAGYRIKGSGIIPLDLDDL